MFLCSGRESITIGNSQDYVLLSDFDTGWSNSCYGHRDRLTDSGDYQRGICRLHYVNNCSSSAYGTGLWSDHGANTRTGKQKDFCGCSSCCSLVVPYVQAELEEQLVLQGRKSSVFIHILRNNTPIESVIACLCQDQRGQNFFYTPRKYHRVTVSLLKVFLKFPL